MANRTEPYLDVAGNAIGGGYRVALIGGGRLRAQVVLDTARDVAAAARHRAAAGRAAGRAGGPGAAGDQ